jgi:hypothetical protein
MIVIADGYEHGSLMPPKKNSIQRNILFESCTPIGEKFGAFIAYFEPLP